MMITCYYMRGKIQCLTKRIAYSILALIISSMIVSCGNDEPSSNIVDLTNAKETNNGYYDGLLYYKLISYSEAKITKCNPEAIEVDIPEKVALNGKQYSISTIDNKAFYNHKELTKVIIPNSVTSIGTEAFSECDKLTIVKMSEGVISIGDLAFYECHALINVNIPNSVTSIGVGSFSDCDGLTNVSLGKSVTTIGIGAFLNCYNLTNVTLPSSVTSIGAWTFGYCSNLSSITCMAIKPPIIIDDEGRISNKIINKLLVPKSSVEAYKSSSWNEAFLEIVGI